MGQFVRRSTVGTSAEALYAWHLRPGAFERLTPPWQAVRIARRDAVFGEGSRVELRIGPGPLALRWVASHHDFVEGRSFVDVQASGPFAAWRHRHGCLPESAGSCTLEDEITFRLPLEPVSRWLGEGTFLRMLERMFRFRHQRTLRDIAAHAAFADRPRLTVAVSGATGLVGKALCAYLATAGHIVRPMVRGEVDPTFPASGPAIRWSANAETVEAGGFDEVDVVIHLAGANVGQRWTEAARREILDSRVKGTRTIARALASASPRRRTFLCASAIGYYGNTERDEPIGEDESPGEGFLADVVTRWEAAAQPALEAGIRTAFLRIGVVLSPQSGALERMLTPFSLGLGGRVGTGRQWLSWIGLDDVLGATEFLMHRDDLEGAFNLTAPGAVRQIEFARTLAKVLRRPAILPVPAFVLRAAFGEMSEVVLEGARVAPGRLLEHGYTFLEPELEGLLRFELGR